MTTTTMTAHELVDAIFAAYNAHNMSAVAALLTDDAVFQDPDGVFTGKEAVLAHEQEHWDAFPDAVWPTDGVHLLTADDGSGLVAVTWTWHGTNTGPVGGLPATGKHCELSGMSIGTITGGLFSQITFYYDSYSLLEQLGLVPKSDSLGFKAMTMAEFALGKAKATLHV